MRQNSKGMCVKLACRVKLRCPFTEQTSLHCFLCKSPILCAVDCLALLILLLSTIAFFHRRTRLRISVQLTVKLELGWCCFVCSKGKSKKKRRVLCFSQSFWSESLQLRGTTLGGFCLMSATAFHCPRRLFSRNSSHQSGLLLLNLCMAACRLDYETKNPEKQKNTYVQPAISYFHRTKCSPLPSGILQTAD